MGVKIFLIRHYLTIDIFHNHVMILTGIMEYNPAKKKMHLHKTRIIYYGICKMLNYLLQLYRKILICKTEKVQLLLRTV